MEHAKRHCENCDVLHASSDSFCPHCGQKVNENILRLSGFIKHLLSALLNYDSSFWKTIRHIFSPGKITNAYINGKRRSYLNPIRLFIFLALLNFLISYLTDTSLYTNTEINMHWQEQQAQHNRVIDQLGLVGKDSFPNDSIQKMYTAFQEMGYAKKTEVNDTNMQELFVLDSVSFNMLNETLIHSSNIQFDARDVVQLSATELFKKYKIEYWWDKLLIGQSLKVASQSDSFFRFIGSKTNWVLLLLIPLQAIILKLLYFNRTYIEHVIYLLHIHSLGYLILVTIKALFFISTKILGQDNDPIAFGLVICSVLGFFFYSWLAALRVYRQSLFITLLKLIPIAISYFIFGLISFLLVLAVGVLFF